MPRHFTDEGDLVHAVTDDPNRIGFTSIAYKNNSHAVPVRGTCGFISTPSDFAIKTGDYPLARRVYLYTTNRLSTVISESKSDKTMAFLGFVKSGAGHVAVETSGFVSQSITALPIEVQGQRLVNTMLADQGDVSLSDIRRMVSELSGAIRLSSTFRFKPNVAELDAQALGDIPRLENYLRNNDFAGREFLIAGFCDAAGGASQNAALSQRRAQQVLDELLAALGDDAGEFRFALKVLAKSRRKAVTIPRLGAL